MFHKNFKSSKTKDFRKQIARILNIIKENRKEEVIKGLREKVIKKEKDGEEGEVKNYDKKS